MSYQCLILHKPWVCQKVPFFRCMRNYGLSVWGNEAVLSDQELDEKLREILEESPNAGYCRVISQLSAAGLRPPQLKVRESM